MISLHDPDSHAPDSSTKARRDEIIDFIVKRFEVDQPCWIKIIDPYFMLANCLEQKDDNNFWVSFIEELQTLKSLQEIKIITRKPFAEYVKYKQDKMRVFENLDSKNIAHCSLESIYDNKIDLIIFHYRQPKNNINKKKLNYMTDGLFGVEVNWYRLFILGVFKKILRVKILQLQK